MHLDNAYFLEHVEIVSHRCKTHTVSNTAFRGFGGPQGMIVIEQILDDIARSARRRSARCATRAISTASQDRNVTHYGQTVEDNLLRDDRRAARAQQPTTASGAQQIAPWNAANRDHQARPGADAGQVRHFVHLDDVQPGRRAAARLHRRHGAAESRRHRDGPGPVHEGRAGRRDGVRTAAVGDPRLGHRHLQGPQHLGERGLGQLGSQRQGGAGGGADDPASVWPHLPCQTYGVDAQEVRFHDGRVLIGEQQQSASRELVLRAYRARISLSSTGFYRTPEDPVGQGDACAGGPSSTSPMARRSAKWRSIRLTGETQLLRVDILHDVGTLAERRDRPRSDRRRLSAGRRLADLRGTVVERAR